mmetsp:Transcript_103401/g.205535  ORF Transcript_103401/g.205535 Transcript_103401/m.205535 type:complete len:591 (-) Transcript_103401:143-1915(-)
MTLLLKDAAMACRGLPDSEWWEAPLDWDLLHVRDQHSRWSKERSWILGLWWAHESDLLTLNRKCLTGIQERLTKFPTWSNKCLAPKIMDIKALSTQFRTTGSMYLDDSCGELGLLNGQVWAIEQEIEDFQYVDFATEEYHVSLEHLIQNIAALIRTFDVRVGKLTELIGPEDVQRARKWSQWSPLSQTVPDLCAGYPTPKEMALVIRKLEAREHQLKLREEQQDAFSAGTNQNNAIEGMLEFLKDTSEQKDKTITDMALELKALHLRLAVLEDRLEQNGSTINKIEHENEALKQTCTELRSDKATLEERCAQNSRTITQLEQDNKSLKGELADMMHSWRLRPIPACNHNHSSLIASVSEGMQEVVEVRDNSSEQSAEMSWDVVSVTSSCSWISIASGSGLHCFVGGSVFKSVSGETEHYLKVEQLMKGSCVLSHQQTKLVVVSHPVRTESDKLIELKTESAFLHVTPNHRVPVWRGNSGGHDVQAKDLKVGDHVFEDHVPTELVSVKEIVLKEKVSVFGITFQPDMPVAVFMAPPGISSKGHPKKHLRRGGMNRRGTPAAPTDNTHCSILDTAEGDSELPDVCKNYHEPR